MRTSELYALLTPAGQRVWGARRIHICNLVVKSRVIYSPTGPYAGIKEARVDDPAGREEFFQRLVEMISGRGLLDRRYVQALIYRKGVVLRLLRLSNGLQQLKKLD